MITRLIDITEAWPNGHAGAPLRMAPHNNDPLSRWVLRLSARAHPNVACVAMANKTARMAWAMLCHGTNYQPALAAA